ncbi:MAG: MBOAT family O-acyltransferase [Bariatricus sp.]
MLFNSYEFILAFLPITLAIYFLACRAKKGCLEIAVLAVASIFFVAFSNIQSAAILLLSVAANYWLGHQISCKQGKAPKAWLILGLLFNIGILGYFKYANFLIDSISEIFESDITLVSVFMPVGLSFYTFQQIAYLVDAYQGEAVPCSFWEYLLYVAFFAKLIQGPIAQQKELIPQFSDLGMKVLNWDNVAKGLSVFAIGLAKKVLVADNFGKIVDYGFNHISSLNSFEAILSILGYTFQIYFDFSGYCDMAVGIGLMFNIKLPQNFNSPYKALSISDFWKRWHIALTNFLTRYIYIPLGGSRKGKVRTYLNILIVFLVSGLWHGAGFTFFLWGLMHGMAMVLERITKSRYEKLPKIIRWILTFAFINITWVFFRAGSVTDAIAMLKQIFTGGWFFSINAELTETLLQPTLISIANKIIGLPVVAILSCIIALFSALLLKNSTERIKCFKPNAGIWFQTYFLLVLSILSFSGVSTFLYSNF